jgi:hypothetical protein
LPICDLRFAILAAVITVVCAGCDARSDDESPAARPREALKTGTGVVRGIVKFVGTPPAMSKIRAEPCHDGASGEIADESVVVNGNGTLRNVFVYIEGAGRGTDGIAREPALLDQVNCTYVPHAVGLQVGQMLNARSSDPTLHNVHVLADRNRATNFGLTGAGQQKQLSFAEPEFIPVKCDVHPWMLAYIGVFENPYFAVTGEDGTFELTRLPAGRFKLVAWHERYGRLEQDVIINEANPTTAVFEYRAPTAIGK